MAESAYDYSGLDPEMVKRLQEMEAAGQLPSDFNPQMFLGLTEDAWAGSDPGETAATGQWDVKASPYEFNRLGLSRQATTGAGGRARRTAQGIAPWRERAKPGGIDYTPFGKWGLPVNSLGEVPEYLVNMSGGTPEETIEYWNSIKGQLSEDQIAKLGDMVNVQKFDRDLIGNALGLTPEQIEQTQSRGIEDRLIAQNNTLARAQGNAPGWSDALGMAQDTVIGMDQGAAKDQMYNEYINQDFQGVGAGGSGGLGIESARLAGQGSSIEDIETQDQFYGMGGLGRGVIGDDVRRTMYDADTTKFTPEQMMLANLTNPYANKGFDPNPTGNWDLYNLTNQRDLMHMAPEANMERFMGGIDPNKDLEFFELEDGSKVYYDPDPNNQRHVTFGDQYQQMDRQAKRMLKEDHSPSWGEKYAGPALKAAVGAMMSYAGGPLGALAYNAMQTATTGQFDPMTMAISLGTSLIPGMMGDMGFGDLLAGNFSKFAGLSGALGSPAAAGASMGKELLAPAALGMAGAVAPGLTAGTMRRRLGQYGNTADELGQEEEL